MQNIDSTLAIIQQMRRLALFMDLETITIFDLIAIVKINFYS